MFKLFTSSFIPPGVGQTMSLFFVMSHLLGFFLMEDWTLHSNSQYWSSNFYDFLISFAYLCIVWLDYLVKPIYTPSHPV